MYTILVCEDNTLFASKKERIMERSKCVDTLQFLVPQFYKEYDMSMFTVMLEYVLPCSKKYRSEILELSEDMYEDHLVYKLPFDTQLTSEPGDIELQLTFTLAELSPEGKPIQRVRKTSTNVVTIVPIAAWSDIIPDSALSAIDQRLIKADAQMKALEEAHNLLNESKADNLKYDNENSTLQLMSGNKEIGNKVIVKSCECDDGVPVVDFNNQTEIIEF